MTIEQIEQWVIYIGGAIVAATPIIMGVEKLALAAFAAAQKTESKIDDRIADFIAKAARGTLDVLSWLPRVSLGLAELRRVRDAVKAVERPRS